MTSPSTLRRLRVPLATVAILALLAIIFRGNLVAWFGGETASSQSKAVAASSGGVDVDVAIEPKAPQSGKNTLVISLSRGNTPIAGADVGVEVWMPAMGAMAEMRSKAEVTEASDGHYRAAFDLAMNGSWTATVSAKIGAQTMTAEYGLTIGTPGLRVSSAPQVQGAAPGVATTSQAEASEKPVSPPYVFGSEAKTPLSTALKKYDVIRLALSNDTIVDIAQAAAIVADTVADAASAETSAPAEIQSHLRKASAAATALGEATSLDTAREQFAVLSEHLLAIIAADSSLLGDLHVFECPMTSGFGQWFQPDDDLKNPYLGQDMLTCGSDLDWEATPAVAVAATPGLDEHVHDPAAIDHYTCPMHPWVKESDPDSQCPVCSMELTPVTKEEITEGIIRVDRERRQVFGVRTATVERKRLTVPVHAVGKVTYDERGLTDVTLRYKGWIEKLHVEETGQWVKKGQPLFEIYSPELFAAQHELILATQQRQSASSDQQQSRADALIRGARKRFDLWGFSDGQIDAIVAKGVPKESLTVRAQASGFVIEKDVVEGAAVEAGQRLFRLANLKKVWVEAEVYEEDLPLVHKGQTASVTMTNLGGAPIIGTVSFFWPSVDPKTRTAKIRIELNNEDFSLKPEMFAEVDLKVDRPPSLVVPEPAILYSGPRRIVFVDLGDDRLRPTLVTLAAKSGGYYEVRSGLKAGDKVVISGNFLVAAESRLKATTGIW